MSREFLSRAALIALAMLAACAPTPTVDTPSVAPAEAATTGSPLDRAYRRAVRPE